MATGEHGKHGPPVQLLVTGALRQEQGFATIQRQPMVEATVPDLPQRPNLVTLRAAQLVSYFCIQMMLI